MALEAVFLQTDPPGLVAGIHWQASLWLTDFRDAGAVGPPPYPVAVAWLTDFRRVPGLDCVLLDFILVPDHRRRSGYAAALVAACRDRWPGLDLTDPISPEGEALAASLGAPGGAPGGGSPS